MAQFLDFQVVKEAVSLVDAMQLLDLEGQLKLAGNIFRGPCPCGRGGDRALVVTPQKGWFCHGAAFGGDVIAMTKHVLDLKNMRDAAVELADRAGISTSTPSTVTVPGNRSRERQEPGSGQEQKNPARSRGASAKGAPHPFDPDEFWAKTTYTEEVAALGISEEQAEELRIGFYRGKLYQALRYADGKVAGYSSFANGELKLPANLLPSNVVPFQKRA